VPARPPIRKTQYEMALPKTIVIGASGMEIPSTEVLAIRLTPSG
jgi:hypothetical protein